MEHLMELCLFVKSTIALYSQRTKDLSEEELQALILILTTPILKSGWKYENLKETLIVNRSTYTSALWSATSSCEDLITEIKMRGGYGVSYYKNVKQLESLISYLREIQTRITQMLIKNTD